jgi:hypothetical protein
VTLPPIICHSIAFEKIFYPAMQWNFHTPDTQAIRNMYIIFNGDSWISPNIVRLPHVQTSFPTHILTLDPPIDNNINLYDACRIRTQDLIDRNRQIVFFWSGGIDSTMALCFLLDQLTHPEQIVVYYTPESVRENPEFVAHIKKFSVKMVRWDIEYNKLFNSEQLIVTGGNGDSCSGNVNVNLYNTNKEWLLKPWQDFLAFKGMSQCDIDRINVIIDRHGIGYIDNLIDLNWWFESYITYQFNPARALLFNLENLSIDAGLAFFDCDVMNQWSLLNRRNLINCKTQHEYKQCFRDEIAKFWPNTEYVTNKPKVRSKHGFNWLSIKLLHHCQDFLFLYWQNGQIKSYMPDRYPIFDREQILQDLRGMQ